MLPSSTLFMVASFPLNKLVVFCNSYHFQYLLAILNQMFVSKNEARNILLSCERARLMMGRLIEFQCKYVAVIATKIIGNTQTTNNAKMILTPREETVDDDKH